MPSTHGADRLPELLAQLSVALASTTTGLNTADRVEPFRQGGYADSWHESLIVLTDLADEPDDAAHLAFAIVPTRAPVRGFRPQPGAALESHPEVSVVFAYRLRPGADGPGDLRMAAAAALEILRVVVDVATWAPDAMDISVEPSERFEPVRPPSSSWLTARVRFTLQNLAEVL